MKLAQLDQHPEYSQGLGPIGQALQWLDTLTKAHSVKWDPKQLAAAKRALNDAHELMLTDVATLAGRGSVARDEAHPQPGPGTTRGQYRAYVADNARRLEAMDRAGEVQS